MARWTNDNATTMKGMGPWKRPYLIPLFAIAAALVLGGVVMLLWNAIIPGLTGWAWLSYPKAIGLLVLCRILFGGFHKHRGHGHGPEGWQRRAEWKERWMKMSDAERQEMRRRWRDRCGHGWQPPPPPAPPPSQAGPDSQ